MGLTKKGCGLAKEERGHKFDFLLVMYGTTVAGAELGAS